MSDGATGRLVNVQTKFSREATKPGGINRSGANMASDRSISAMKAQVEGQIEKAIVPLMALLRAWPDVDVAKGCQWAAQTRDLAGLAGMHLLTEVAMHTFDCLDVVLIDKVDIRPEEAACYADALAFAQQGLCRGSDLEPFMPLLRDLETLTNRVVARAEVKTAR